MTPIKIIETSDGSQSLFHEELNETYHSTHGALTESEHVFIKHGLDYLNNSGKNQINILEVGFGTGLNALLTQGYATLNTELRVDYVTLEPFPLKEELIAELKYYELLKDQVSKEDFLQLHACQWEQKHVLNDSLFFTKHQTTLQEFNSDILFDLVFYDAFAPSKQAEMWDFEVLKKLTNKMASGGVLVTYCARGQFKRDLAALNMSVETLSGPPGKKEMVRGTLPS